MNMIRFNISFTTVNTLQATDVTNYELLSGFDKPEYQGGYHGHRTVRCRVSRRNRPGAYT